MWFNVLKNVLKVLVLELLPYVFDYGSDWVNGVEMAIAGQVIWATVCLTLTAAPGLVAGCSELLLYQRTKDKVHIVSGIVCILFGWILLPLLTIIGYMYQMCNPGKMEDRLTTGQPIPFWVRMGKQYKIMEGFVEATGQLILSLSILFIAGFREKSYLFKGDVQSFSIVCSFVSILKATGDQHFLGRSPFFPGQLKEILLASLTFCPDVIFRTMSIAIITPCLGWWSFLPIITTAAIIYKLTAWAGITARDDRMLTTFLSLLVPAVFVDEQSDDGLSLPAIQKSYYKGNRLVMATIIGSCLTVVTILLNLGYHVTPLALTVTNFNSIILPMALICGLFTLVPGPTVLKYDERITRNEDGLLIRENAENIVESEEGMALGEI